MSRVHTQMVAHDAGLTINRVQDCTPYADYCARQRTLDATGSSDMRHAARLPMVLVEQYCNTHNITFDQFMQDKTHINAMLNDPALQGFRIWQGKV